MPKVPPLEIDGLSTQELLEKIEHLHENLKASVLSRYDLEEQFKLRQYDIIELNERVRQMSKGSQGKRDRSMSVAVGADRLSDKYTNAPPKVEVCSKYDRKTDSRSYDQKRTLYASPLAKAPLPGLPSALIDKTQEIQILTANRNVVGYDKIKNRTSSLSNLPAATAGIPVNSLVPPPPIKKHQHGNKKKGLRSIDEASDAEDAELQEEQSHQHEEATSNADHDEYQQSHHDEEE